MEDKRFQSKYQVAAKVKRTKVKNIFFIFLGFFFLVLGVLGIALPVLPTTPLVLLAAGCFSAGSPKLLNWLMQNKILGPYIENYRNGQGISKIRKISAIVFLWVGLLVSMLMVQTVPIIIILGIVGIGVTVHLLRVKIKK